MQEHLKRLVETRARAWEQMKELLDRVEAEGRDLNSEEKEKFDRLNLELDELDERVDTLHTRLEREKQADERMAEIERIVRPEEDRRQPDDSLEDRVVRWARGEGGRAIEVPLKGIEVRRSRSGLWEVRDLVTSTAAAGGATVPTSFRAQLYEHLVENSAIRQTRAEIITTNSGEPLILPKTTKHPGGTLVAEGSVIPEDDPAFSQGTLLAYKYGDLIQVSSELLSDTGVELLSYLARAAGQALGNITGGALVVGDGNNEPHGVIAAAGSVAEVTGGTGLSGAPTADDLIDLYYKVSEPYARNGEWFMRRSTVGKIRKLKDANDQYLWQPALTAGAPDTLLGHPIVQDPNVPAVATDATAIAFGDFSAYKIRDVGAIRFERSDDFAFDRDLVTFRALMRTDGELLDTTGAIGVFVGGTA